jgi:hypothetical protein
MDAFELLKNDHRKVSTLFKEIESASTEAKSEGFAKLKAELDLHANMEETIFYPALDNTDEAREITLEAYEEHKVVKELLAELDGAPVDEEWSAKLTVLKENVEHHVEEEEGELFSKARQALSQEEIDELGDEMESAKASAGSTDLSAMRSRRAKKSESAGPTGKKIGAKKGLLGTLAEIVGLGGGSKSRKQAQKATRRAKSAAKSPSKSRKAGKTGAGKAATKSRRSTEKAGGQKAAAKRATKKGSARSDGKRAAVKSRSAALKRTSSKRGLRKTGAKKR